VSERTRQVAKLAAPAAVALILWLFVWPSVWGGSMTYLTVSGPSMEPLYASGDFVAAREQPSYAAGDIVVFSTGQGNVIHRIVGGDGQAGYLMQGDNNPDVDRWTPTDAEVLGKAVLHVPNAGDAVMLARDVLVTPPFPYLLAGFVFLVIALGGDAKQKIEHEGPAEAPEPEPASA
jgi:signal peptidase